MTTPPKLLAAVAGAMVLAVGIPSPWGFPRFGIGGKGTPGPGVIPSTTWLVALVCIGAGGPGT